MQTGPDRFALLVDRTVGQLAGHTGLGERAVRDALSGLVLEHEVVRRRWAPRLQALRAMGEELDAIVISWPKVHVPGRGWMTVEDAIEAIDGLIAKLHR